MLILIEVQQLSPDQVATLTAALPDDKRCSRVSLDFHVEGSYYSLPVQAVEGIESPITTTPPPRTISQNRRESSNGQGSPTGIPTGVA
jgi:hypothetical protein